MAEIAAKLVGLGWTPGAIGIWLGVLLIIGWFLKEYRETRKLSSNDKQARREGYAKQVEMLMGENRALLGDLQALRKEYDDHRQFCNAETKQLREMLVAVENEQSGISRKLTDANLEIARLKGYEG